jgi:hypothetical protein
MSLALLLALALAPPAGATLPPEVEAAARASLSTAGARLVPLSYTPTGSNGACRPTEVTLPRPVEGSGRYAVKLAGGGCHGWAWLRVDVYAPVPVLTRAVREGEPLEEAVALVERLVTSGNLPPAVTASSTASRALPRGRALTPSDVQQSPGGALGTVKVVVRSGALAIEALGRLIACGAGRSCAVLGSGKHVEGRLEEGRLLVELP